MFDFVSMIPVVFVGVLDDAVVDIVALDLVFRKHLKGFDDRRESL